MDTTALKYLFNDYFFIRSNWFRLYKRQWQYYTFQNKETLCLSLIKLILKCQLKFTKSFCQNKLWEKKIYPLIALSKIDRSFLTCCCFEVLWKVNFMCKWLLLGKCNINNSQKPLSIQQWLLHINWWGGKVFYCHSHNCIETNILWH